MTWEDILKSNIKDMVMDAFVGKYRVEPRLQTGRTRYAILEDDLGYVPLGGKTIKNTIKQVTTGFGTTEVSGYTFSFKQLKGRRLEPDSGTLTITDKSNGKKLVAQRKYYEPVEDEYEYYDNF
jgi:hypothetical protein